MTRRTHFLGPLIGAAPGEFGLDVERTGATLATTLELAGDSGTRRRGLLGRDGLDPHTALIIAPCNAVHTFFMRFTIDVVFADRDGRVLAVVSSLKPWRLAASMRAFAAVELAEGAIGQAGIGVGDVVRVRASPSQAGNSG